jgi:hypothetical protein
MSKDPREGAQNTNPRKAFHGRSGYFPLRLKNPTGREKPPASSLSKAVGHTREIWTFEATPEAIGIEF